MWLKNWSFSLEIWKKTLKTSEKMLITRIISFYHNCVKSLICQGGLKWLCRRKVLMRLINRVQMSKTFIPVVCVCVCVCVFFFFLHSASYKWYKYVTFIQMTDFLTDRNPKHLLTQFLEIAPGQTWGKVTWQIVQLEGKNSDISCTTESMLLIFTVFLLLLSSYFLLMSFSIVFSSALTYGTRQLDTRHPF